MKILHMAKASEKTQKKELTTSSKIDDNAPQWTIKHLGEEAAHYNDALNQKILKHLVKLGLLTAEQTKLVLDLHQKKAENILDAIIELEIMKSNDLGRAVAEYFSVPYVNLKNTRVSPDAALLVPEEVSKSEGVLSYTEDQTNIFVAMVNPSNQHFLHMLEKKTGKKAMPHFTTPAEIRSAQQIYRQDTLKGFQYLIDRATENIGKLETLNNISSIFDTVVLMAYYRNASDIHIEPFENEIRIRLRVDGVLNNVAQLPIHFLETMVNHVKVLSKLRTDEHNSSQDGRFKVTYNNATINFRVSILPSYYGEKMVLRLLSSESQQLSLEDLGYSAAEIDLISKNIQKTQGMVLITGPTGSGKTTTLYSMLSNLNQEGVNISTIEDPIEYGLYGVNQVQVNAKTNLTFADGLRSLLRQDPDILMIGEIRDLDTAKISAHSALTGHLILSTLHTSSAALAPLRLIKMGLDPYSIVSTLNIIIAQRLTRTVCNACRVTYQVSAAEIKEIEDKFISSDHDRDIFSKNFHAKKNSSLRLFKGKGCDECGGSGFKGRTVVAEAMEMTNELRDLIVKEASQDEIENAAIENGMVTMLEDGLNKVFEGKTTLEELFRVINQ